MNNLIKVNYDNENPAVSGRELHQFLEVGTEYMKWFERMAEYGFSADLDYSSILTNRSDGLVGKPRTDHALSLDMAKELAMLQRTDKGKQARQYFIAIEKAWNNPETVMARALKMADGKIKLLETTNHALQIENDTQRQLIVELQPLAAYAKHILSCLGTLTITQIAADYNMTASKLNKILYEERIQRKVGDQWILYREHMNQGYTKSETIHFNRSDGTPDTKLHTKWTQKGRLMINEVLNQRGIYANMDLVQTA